MYGIDVLGNIIVNYIEIKTLLKKYGKPIDGQPWASG